MCDRDSASSDSAEREITAQLSDAELTAVLSHEMTHVRRKHILLERIWAYICILNWFNPLVWGCGKRVFPAL